MVQRPCLLAGGMGEFFSLTGDEYPSIIKTAVDHAVAADDLAEHWRLHNALVLFNPAPVT